MKVWRVAHETATFDGFPSGPYACAETLPNDIVIALRPMFEGHCNMEHPSPYHDTALRGIAPFERCGFASLESLYEWFDRYTGTLDECGFKVYVYDVPGPFVRSGRNRQAVFAADRATLLETFALDLHPVQLDMFGADA